MTINLLRELESGDYELAFFMTYTLGLRFFEELVLPRLHRAGAARIAILADHKGYQDSLFDPVAAEQCGREYMLAAAEMPRRGIQHAKLMWLQSRDRVVAYVGSHNLTMAGFNDQVELSVRLDSRNPGHTQALRDLFAAVDRVVPDRLRKVWSHASPPRATHHPPSVHLLTNLDAPLADQLVSLVGSADQMRVVTPFLDADTIGRLATRVSARRSTLDLPKDGADTPLAAALDQLPLATARFLTGDRQLHAKAFEFRTNGGIVLAIGSANCTQAALERTATEAKGNLEFLAVMHGVALPDEGLSFAEVAKPDEFPYTGRAWDAGRCGPGRLKINRAEYCDGRLDVEWTWTSPDHGQTVELSLDGEPIGSFAENVTLKLAQAPRLVELRDPDAAEPSAARAWIENTKLLEAQVHRRRIHRWLERIASDDPMEHASAIDAYFDQILRELSSVRGSDDLAAAHVSPGLTEAKTRARSIRDAVEVFTFSPDPDKVRAKAAELLSGPKGADPLTILRALIARHMADPPPYLQEDPDLAARHERRRERARKMITARVVRHLQSLGSPELDWTNTSPGRVRLCLAQTFGAVALVWHDVEWGSSSAQSPSRLAEAFVGLLDSLGRHPAALALMKDPVVAGPLILSLGAVSLAAGGDATLIGKLRAFGRGLAGNDPRPVLETWRRECPDQAGALLATVDDSDLLMRWEPPVLRLFGIAPQHTRRHQSTRWGMLLEVQAADSAHSPGAADLFREASALYGRDPVWLRYVRSRQAGRFAIIGGVREARCDRCHLKLPVQREQQLNRGEAVICDCGRILLFGLRPASAA